MIVILFDYFAIGVALWYFVMVKSESADRMDDHRQWFSPLFPVVVTIWPVMILAAILSEGF